MKRVEVHFAIMQRAYAGTVFRTHPAPKYDAVYPEYVPLEVTRGLFARLDQPRADWPLGEAIVWDERTRDIYREKIWENIR